MRRLTDRQISLNNITPHYEQRRDERNKQRVGLTVGIRSINDRLYHRLPAFMLQ